MAKEALELVREALLALAGVGAAEERRGHHRGLKAVQDGFEDV